MTTNAQRVAAMRAYIKARGEASSAEIKAHLGEPTLCVSGLLKHLVKTGTLRVRKIRVPGMRSDINAYREAGPPSRVRPALKKNTRSAKSTTVEAILGGRRVIHRLVG